MARAMHINFLFKLCLSKRALNFLQDNYQPFNLLRVKQTVDKLHL